MERPANSRAYCILDTQRNGMRSQGRSQSGSPIPKVPHSRFLSIAFPFSAFPLFLLFSPYDPLLSVPLPPMPVAPAVPPRFPQLPQTITERTPETAKAGTSPAKAAPPLPWQTADHRSVQTGLPSVADRPSPPPGSRWQSFH